MQLAEHAQVRARQQVEMTVRMVALIRAGYTPEDVRARLGVTVAEHKVMVRLLKAVVEGRDE